MRRLSHHLSLIALVYLALTAGLAAVLGPVPAAANPPIPQDAIRIRIIANSDTVFDQKVKQDVRDQVADLIRSWGAMPTTHDGARALIKAHLPDVQRTADRVLNRWDAAYGAKLELAEVPFPDKIFEGRTYKAGNYEALRIALGDAQGANWWCVLFPPLCLTAATAPDDKAQSPKAPSTAGGQSENIGKAKSVAKPATKTFQKAATTDARQHAEQKKQDAKPKAKFFLWELIRKLADILKAFFA